MIPCLLAAALAGSVVPPGSVPAATAEVALAVRGAPLPERIARISATWIDVPYALDPAGEGEGHDEDPPGRYDAFDCLTFVEEVLSLALAPDPIEAGAVRAALRWSTQPPSHATRHHHMELQWIPSALAQGWLRDTTSSYGVTQRRTRTITAEDWRRWSGTTRLGLPEAAWPVGTMALDVLPLATAQAVRARFAPGSLLLVVRSDRSDVPLWITHVAFVLPGGKLRHASQLRSSQRVTDHDLGVYLGLLASWSRWPVDGVVVLEPVEQGPTRRAP